MKYYRLNKVVDKIDDKYWIHLVRGEPTLEPLTKQEYENYRGIKPTGESDVHVEDVTKPVAEGAKKEAGPQISGENTKKEIIAEILNRGIDISESKLKQKNKQQLLELL